MRRNHDPNIKTVSYSQYSTWTNCPWQWKLKYVDGIRPDDASIETVFGTAMHNTIQKFVTHLFENEKLAIKTAYDVVLLDELKSEFSKTIKIDDAGNKSFICTKDVLQEYYDDGCKILHHLIQHYKDFIPVKKHKLIGIELELTEPVFPGVAFVAYLDLVIYNELTKKYTIIDFKTSRAGWTYQKKDKLKINQLLIYKKFYSKLFNVSEDDIIPEFIILKRKITENALYKVLRLSKFIPSHGSRSLKTAMESWDTFLSTCYSSSGERRTEAIHPLPSASNCKYCPFKLNKTLCPDGFYKK